MVAPNEEGAALTPIEPGQLWVMRIHALLVAVPLLIGGNFLDLAVGEQTAAPRGAVVLPLIALLLFLVLVAPNRRWRAWGYRMDGDELEVRRGVWTQVHSVVPLHRVQHIDISQGAIERGFAVCRLVVHTAGTMHSQVVLPGLSRPTAEAMRDEIRSRIRQEEE